MAPRLVVAADTEPSRAQYAVDVLGYAAGTTDYREVLAEPRGRRRLDLRAQLPARRDGRGGRRGGQALLDREAGRSRLRRGARPWPRAAEAAGVVTSVGFNYRHAPAVEHIKELVAERPAGPDHQRALRLLRRLLRRSARSAVLAVPARVRRQRRPRRPGQPRHRPVHVPGRPGDRRDGADLHRAHPAADPADGLGHPLRRHRGRRAGRRGERGLRRRAAALRRRRSRRRRGRHPRVVPGRRRSRLPLRHRDLRHRGLGVLGLRAAERAQGVQRSRRRPSSATSPSTPTPRTATSPASSPARAARWASTT